MIDILKRCTICKEDKNRTEFRKAIRKNRPIGYQLSSRCKPCDRIYWVTRKQDPSFYKKVSSSTKKRLTKYRNIVLEYYGNKCSCCKEENYLFLTIDHINNDGYKDLTASGYRYSGMAMYLRLIREKFPKGYQILCFNCNLGKARNSGICPHVRL